MDFKVTEQEKFVDMDSESTSQPMFKGLPRASFSRSIKEEYPQCPEAY